FAFLKHLHDAADIDRAAIAFVGVDAGQDAVAHAGGNTSTLLHADGDEGRRAFGLIFLVGGAGDQSAFSVTRENVEHNHIRQMAGANVLLAAGTDRTFRLKLSEYVLQPDAMFALDVEGFGELA